MNQIGRAVLMVLIAVFFILGVYFTFFYAKDCGNFECFQNAMKKCSHASYVSNEPEADWYYKISGKSGDQCLVYVKLLNAKEGELGIDKLIGYDMECYMPKGYIGYPDKDLSRCSGKLKEEFQGIIIKKLHSYILENLGEINQSLNRIS